MTDTTQTPAEQAHATPPPVSRWRVARAAGAGSASAVILAMELSRPGSFIYEATDKKLLFAMAGVVLVILGISIIEPFIEWVHRGDENQTHHRPRSFWRQIIGTLLVLLVTFLFAAVDGLLHETLVKVDYRVVIGWFAAMFTSGIVTYAWLRGVWRGPPYATMYGVVAAASVILVFFVILVLSVVVPPAVRGQPLPGKTISEVVGNLMVFWLVPLSAWVLSGLLGGLALDYGRGLTPSLRVLFALAVAWIVYTYSTGRLTDEPQTWVADLVRGLGWGLGLVLYRPSERALAGRKTPFTPSWTTAFKAIGVGAAACAIVFGGLMALSIRLEKNIIGQVTYLGSHKAAVSRLGTFEHGKYLVTTARNRAGQTLDEPDFEIRFWDAGDESDYRRLKGHTDEVLDFHEVEHEEFYSLVSIGKERILRAWNVSKGMEDTVFDFDLKLLVGDGFQPVLARFHSENTQVLLIDSVGLMKVFDWKDKSILRTIEPVGGQVIGAEWIDEERFLLLTGDGIVRRVSMDLKEHPEELGRHQANGTHLAVSNNHTFAISGDSRGELLVWDFRSLETPKLVKPSKFLVPITCAAISDDGKRLLYATTESNEVHAIEISSGEDLMAMAHPGLPTTCRFLKYSQAVTGGGDGGIRVWRLPH